MKRIAAEISSRFGHLTREAFNPRLQKLRPLFDFSTLEGYQSHPLQVVSDKAFGGTSVVTLDAPTAEQPYVLFRGVLRPSEKLSISGFAAVRSRPPALLNWDLSDFDGLELHLGFLEGADKLGGFLVNAQTDSYVKEDVYQALVRTEGYDASKQGIKAVRIPFDNFLLTWKGHVQQAGIALNTSQIRTFGVSVALPNNRGSVVKPDQAADANDNDSGVSFAIAIQRINAYRKDS